MSKVDRSKCSGGWPGDPVARPSCRSSATAHSTNAVDVRVGDHHALGRAGRAGREEDVRRVVRIGAAPDGRRRAAPVGAVNAAAALRPPRRSSDPTGTSGRVALGERPRRAALAAGVGEQHQARLAGSRICATRGAGLATSIGTYAQPAFSSARASRRSPPALFGSSRPRGRRARSRARAAARASRFAALLELAVGQPLVAHHERERRRAAAPPGAARSPAAARSPRAARPSRSKTIAGVLELLLGTAGCRG